MTIQDYYKLQDYELWKATVKWVCLLTFLAIICFILFKGCEVMPDAVGGVSM